MPIAVSGASVNAGTAACSYIRPCNRQRHDRTAEPLRQARHFLVEDAGPFRRLRPGRLPPPITGRRGVDFVDRAPAARQAHLAGHPPGHADQPTAERLGLADRGHPRRQNEKSGLEGVIGVRRANQPAADAVHGGPRADGLSRRRRLRRDRRRTGGAGRRRGRGTPPLGREVVPPVWCDETDGGGQESWRPWTSRLRRRVQKPLGLVPLARSPPTPAPSRRAHFTSIGHSANRRVTVPQDLRLPRRRLRLVMTSGMSTGMSSRGQA